MTNQSIRFLKEILKDVMVRIHDQFALADFMVLYMNEEEDDTPIILRRSFLNTTNAIIYVDSAKICFIIKDRKEKFSFKNRIL